MYFGVICVHYNIYSIICAYREKIERMERKTKIERRNEIESKLGPHWNGDFSIGKG